MAIHYQILGDSGRDNVLYVTIDTGQNIFRLLFDCGSDCLLPALSIADIQSIDHLFFSHFHMDHISGFDTFFRINYGRATRENHIWGPVGAAGIMWHRFRGFGWNLYDELESEWYVHDIDTNVIATHLFFGCDAFLQGSPVSSEPYKVKILDNSFYSVEAYVMNHNTPSIAYIVREKSSVNIDTEKLADMGLRGGSWIRDVKSRTIPDEKRLVVDGKSYTIGELRASLLVETPGDSIAYLSDFLLDDAAEDVLSRALNGVKTMVCESQYRHEDIELAEKNYHMTATQVAKLAKRANVENLILFHVSDRYDRDGLSTMLHEAQQIYPDAQFPAHWRLDSIQMT